MLESNLESRDGDCIRKTDVLDATNPFPANDRLMYLISNLRDDELEVLEDLLSDLPLKAIASKRSISRRTVQFRKKHLLEFFGCRSLVELAAFLAQRGWTGTKLDHRVVHGSRVLRSKKQC